MKVRERPIWLDSGCAELPCAYSATAHFPNFSLGILHGHSSRMPSRFCHSEPNFLLFPVSILYASHCLLDCKILVCFCLPYQIMNTWRKELYFVHLYTSHSMILCRGVTEVCWSQWNFLEFGENFIHLHIDSFHSVSFSWICFRKWPPSLCCVSTRMLGISNE